MRILCLGSMNLDYVYGVQDFVKAGETVSALSRDVCCGGKGLNQSIALSKAGAPVWHAGLLGEDGAPLRAVLEENGVSTGLVREVPGPSSHTVSTARSFRTASRRPVRPPLPAAFTALAIRPSSSRRSSLPSPRVSREPVSSS